MLSSVVALHNRTAADRTQMSTRENSQAAVSVAATNAKGSLNSSMAQDPGGVRIVVGQELRAKQNHYQKMKDVYKASLRVRYSGRKGGKSLPTSGPGTLHGSNQKYGI